MIREPFFLTLLLPAALWAADTPPASPSATDIAVLATSGTADKIVPAPQLRRHVGRKQNMPSTGESRVARANRSALQAPKADRFLNAVQVYPWSEGALYRLYAAPGQVSDIVLEAGETLVAVASGDTARWTVGDTVSGAGAGKRTHILIKPFESGLKTNLVITTDRRSYHLSLESTTRTAMHALSWTYPASALLAFSNTRAEARDTEPVAAGLAIDRLRFDYVISGDDPAWRPLRAFDDGRQVFIEFSETLGTSEAPPLFLVGAKGGAELVNYRLRGRFYIVDRLFAVAELRLGAKPQQIVRISLDPRRARKERRRG